MPAKYVRRDPDSPAQVWDERTREEMGAALRDPAGLPHVGPVVRVDQKTVRLRDASARGVYRLEFDLYEGWYEAGRSAAPRSAVVAAMWLGCSLLEYLAAPESAQNQAQIMADAERETVLLVAEPLLSAIREIYATMTATGLSPYSQSWYGRRYEQVEQILLDVLARHPGGSPARTQSVLRRVLTTKSKTGDILSHMDHEWFHTDHVIQAGPAFDIDLYQVKRILREHGVRADTIFTGSGNVSLYAGGEPDDESYVLVVGPATVRDDSPGAIAKTSELWISLDREGGDDDGGPLAREAATTAAEVAEVIIRWIHTQRSRDAESG